MNMLLPAAVVLVGCAHLTGSGHLVTQERTTAAFTGVRVEGGFDATLHRGSAQKVVVKADDNLIAQVETKVEDGVLVVKLPHHSGIDHATLQVEVTAPELTRVESSGGTHVHGDGPKGTECRVEASGGTEVALKGVACESLELSASGGADVKLDGAAKKLDLSASGGVDLHTTGLKVADAKLDASGGVSGEVAVSENLDADFSGGVSLKIKGHPRVKRFGTSGGADADFED